ncbi:MAG: lipid-A-disaccharide synthase [Deltaproteobacteria bacterium]|nr:lipid-A-disaccharide synthase [Deltaproteobacteria bacterium]
MEKKLLIVSGEASGDLHGSALIKEIKRLAPDAVIKGMGGPRMLEAGLLGMDSSKIAVVGIFEVLKKFPAIKSAFNALERMLDSERFDCVVLIDYPDFNLRFAKKAKKRGIKIVYYISPQIWAWRKSRINYIAKTVDKMLVILPFEKELYSKTGLDVEYVGHPLTEIAVCRLSKEEAREALGIKKDELLVTLLPGSRTEEIERLLGPMNEAIKVLSKRLGRPVRAVLAAADSVSDELIDRASGETRNFVVVRGKTYEALRAADSAVVASGTATLETALLGTPMVIVYRLSPLSYHIGKLLIDLTHIGLPNIIAGEEVVPELIQNAVTPENIAHELTRLLTDKAAQKHVMDGYAAIRKKLDKSFAPENAARAVLKTAGMAI